MLKKTEILISDLTSSKYAFLYFFKPIQQKDGLLAHVLDHIHGSRAYDLLYFDQKIDNDEIQISAGCRIYSVYISFNKDLKINDYHKIEHKIFFEIPNEVEIKSAKNTCLLEGLSKFYAHTQLFTRLYDYQCTSFTQLTEKLKSYNDISNEEIIKRQKDIFEAPLAVVGEVPFPSVYTDYFRNLFQILNEQKIKAKKQKKFITDNEVAIPSLVEHITKKETLRYAELVYSIHIEDDWEYEICQMAMDILGDTLYTLLRDEKGLVYKIKIVNLPTTRNKVYYFITFRTQPHHYAEVKKIIQGEVGKKLIKNPNVESLFKLAIQRAIFTCNRNESNLTNTNLNKVRQYIQFGAEHYISPAEMKIRIQKITISDIQTFIDVKAVFRPAHEIVVSETLY